MNTLLDNVEDEDAGSQRDREITLGTTTLLGIFFGLAILCAAFFGFGYSIGSKRTPPAVTASADSVALRNLPGAKPSSGNPYAAPVPAKGDSEAASNPAPVPAPRVSAAVRTAAQPGTTAPPQAFQADPPATREVKPLPVAASLPVAAPAPAASTGAQQFVVQVAALSHPEDAQLIQTTLERRGYTVAVRADANDHLLHVQVGPFSTHKDAEVMRQKLLADGFNAYIK